MTVPMQTGHNVFWLSICLPVTKLVNTTFENK